MRDDQKVTDWDGNELEVGTRAIYGSPPPGAEAEYAVTVVSISDYDVDYSDELERAECYPPRVKVRFDDGEIDTVVTHESTKITWNDYPDGPAVVVFAADDLEVVKLRSVPPDNVVPINAGPYDLEGDYNGKTASQEAFDAMRALAIVLVASFAGFIAVGILVWWWLR